jgi:hypothetical protein
MYKMGESTKVCEEEVLPHHPAFMILFFEVEGERVGVILMVCGVIE